MSNTALKFKCLILCFVVLPLLNGTTAFPALPAGSRNIAGETAFVPLPGAAAAAGFPIILRCHTGNFLPLRQCPAADGLR